LRDWIYANPAGIPTLKQPNADEVQAFRVKAGPTAHNQNDQDVRAFLMNERLNYVRKVNPDLAQQLEFSHRKLQPGQPMPNQMNPQMALGQAQQNPQLMQHAAMRAMQMAQNNNNLMGGMGQVPQNMQQSSQMIQQAQMLFQNQRTQPTDGSIGMNNMQGLMHGGSMPGQAPQLSGLNPQQLTQMTQEQRMKVESDMKAAAGAKQHAAQAQLANMTPRAPAAGSGNQPLPPQMIMTAEKEQQFNSIVSELKRTTPRGTSLPFDQATKEQMAARCRQFMPLVSRVEACIKPFYAYYGNAELVADMIRCVSFNST